MLSANIANQNDRDSADILASQPAYNKEAFEEKNNRPSRTTAEDSFADPVPLKFACELSLGRLFVFDELFNDSALLEPNRSTMRDIIIIDALLNDGYVFSQDNSYSTADLFILDRLFDQGKLLDEGGTTLEDLIVLKQLFNNR